MDGERPTKTTGRETRATPTPPATSPDKPGEGGTGSGPVEEPSLSAAIARRRALTSRLMEQVVEPGWWRRSHSPPVQEGLSIRWFKEQGLVGLLEQYVRLQR